MMETKLWIVALCALLLINLGSAEHDGDHATASSSASQSGLDGVMASEAPATASSSLGPITHTAAAPSLDDTDPSLSKNTTTTEVETNSVIPKPVKVNDTDIVSPSESPASENKTVLSTQQPANPPPGNPTPTPDTLPASTTTTTHTTHTTTVNTSTTAPTTTTHAEHPLPVTPSKESSHNNTSTPVPTPEPPMPELTTSDIVQCNTGSSSENPKSDSTTKSPLNTSQPDRHPETSTKAQLKTTTNPPSSPTAQARSHPQTPSQLNVGGEPTMVHESPTLDPLLAGLVSAFIITAVIITLLLFLKLRRRDNRPEFRRLQDLPMDDMMEDTPLSMYSY